MSLEVVVMQSPTAGSSKLNAICVVKCKPLQIRNMGLISL